jgi:hypothetical protein
MGAGVPGRKFRKINVLTGIPGSSYKCGNNYKNNSTTHNERKKMNTQSNNGYMLIFRGTDWCKGLSPEEMQQVSGEWMAWYKRLTDEGKVIGGNPLESSGKIVSGKGGRVVADGPFAESKEAIGGYFMLQVGSVDEAVAIAQHCPGLPYGTRVEVRPVAEICPAAAAAQAQAELAGATA